MFGKTEYIYIELYYIKLDRNKVYLLQKTNILRFVQ